VAVTTTEATREPVSQEPSLKCGAAVSRAQRIALGDRTDHVKTRNCVKGFNDDLEACLALFPAHYPVLCGQFASRVTAIQRGITLPEESRRGDVRAFPLDVEGSGTIWILLLDDQENVWLAHAKYVAGSPKRPPVPEAAWKLVQDLADRSN
jgi:hypothetical protein